MRGKPPLTQSSPALKRNGNQIQQSRFVLLRAASRCLNSRPGSRLLCNVACLSQSVQSVPVMPHKLSSTRVWQSSLHSRAPLERLDLNHHKCQQWNWDAKPPVSLHGSPRSSTPSCFFQRHGRSACSGWGYNEVERVASRRRTCATTSPAQKNFQNYPRNGKMKRDPWTW